MKSWKMGANKNVKGKRATQKFAQKLKSKSFYDKKKKRI